MLRRKSTKADSQDEGSDLVSPQASTLEAAARPSVRERASIFGNWRTPSSPPPANVPQPSRQSTDETDASGAPSVRERASHFDGSSASESQLTRKSTDSQCGDFNTDFIAQMYRGSTIRRIETSPSSEKPSVASVAADNAVTDEAQPAEASLSRQKSAMLRSRHMMMPKAAPCPPQTVASQSSEASTSTPRLSLYTPRGAARASSSPNLISAMAAGSSPSQSSSETSAEAPRVSQVYTPRGAARASSSANLIHKEAAASRRTAPPAAGSGDFNTDFISQMYRGSTIRRIETSPSSGASKPTVEKAAADSDDDDDALLPGLKRSPSPGPSQAHGQSSKPKTPATEATASKVVPAPAAADLSAVTATLSALRQEVRDLHDGQKRMQRELDTVKRRLAVAEHAAQDAMRA